MHISLVYATIYKECHTCYYIFKHSLFSIFLFRIQNDIQICLWVFLSAYPDVSFRNLNEIIHLNAGNIPEYIRHYASAAFVNGDFWNDLSKIEENMKFKGYHTDYILSYMNYVKMQCTIYNLVTKGKFSIVCTFFIYKKINIRHFSHILLIYCKNTIPLFAFKTASSDDFLSI